MKKDKKFEFNPKLEDWIKDKTLLGLWWAFTWRIFVIYILVMFVISFFLILFE